MAKKWLKKWMPKPEAIKNNRYLKIFGPFVHNHYLWHFNRHCVARAFAIGLFWAMIPIPFQMLPAAAFAIMFRANLPLSMALVWVSNPFTMPPIFYFNYKIGILMLGKPISSLGGELSWHWIVDKIGQIWLPLYLGSIAVGLVSAIVGFFVIKWLWRRHIVKAWRLRHSVR
tara:strand:+ start:185376 stop:185888 length:513 start_codon:yes stop_codon:yes gene_type:complete